MESDNVNNTLSRRRFFTKLSVNAKIVQHDEESYEIIPVKLCYRKQRSPIGCGRFGIVTAAKVISVSAKNGEKIEFYKTEVAVKTLMLRPVSLKV